MCTNATSAVAADDDDDVLKFQCQLVFESLRDLLIDRISHGRSEFTKISFISKPRKFPSEMLRIFSNLKKHLCTVVQRANICLKIDSFEWAEFATWPIYHSGLHSIFKLLLIMTPFAISSNNETMNIFNICACCFGRISFLRFQSYQWQWQRQWTWWWLDWFSFICIWRTKIRLGVFWDYSW